MVIHNSSIRFYHCLYLMIILHVELGSGCNWRYNIGATIRSLPSGPFPFYYEGLWLTATWEPYSISLRAVLGKWICIIPRYQVNERQVFHTKGNNDLANVSEMLLWALAPVAQWIEYHAANWKVTSSIPGQGTCLATNQCISHTLFPLSLFLPHFSSL